MDKMLKGLPTLSLSAPSPITQLLMAWPWRRQARPPGGLKLHHLPTLSLLADESCTVLLRPTTPSADSAHNTTNQLQAATTPADALMTEATILVSSDGGFALKSHPDFLQALLKPFYVLLCCISVLVILLSPAAAVGGRTRGWQVTQNEPHANQVS